MIYKAHYYQDVATNMIIDNKSCGLLLDCGMGKTVATLQAIDDLMYDYFEIDRVLVIAPKKVARDTWIDEVNQWDHLKHLDVSVVIGTASQREKALRRRADIYCINREMVSWLVDRYRSKWPFDMVVIDELSSFKSSKAQRFKDLKKVMPLVKKVVGLTGTPTPNGLIDLWPQMYLLDRGERLGKTVSSYRRKYFSPGMTNGHVVYNWRLNKGSSEAIYKAIGDICISMQSVDHLKMPKRIDNIISVRMNEKARRLYRQMEKDLLLPFVNGDVVAANSAVLSNKLLQMASGAVYDEEQGIKKIHDAKLEALQDLIESANGQPVIIFYWFKHDYERIKKILPDARDLKTHEDMNEWNRGEIPILLMHPASAGHGLNLQHGGHIAVWFSLPWSLELYQQANARLYRQGQDSDTVILHHLVAEGTVDEQVIKALRCKSMGQDELMKAVKARIESIK